MPKRILKFELFYLLATVFILLAGILHFVLLILKIERELNISFMVVTMPALIAYGLGAVLFSQFSAYWFFYATNIDFKINKKESPLKRKRKIRTQRIKLGLGFAALFILAIGSMITQLMLALKFDLVKNYTFTQSFLPVLIAFILSSIVFIVNLYVGADLAFPFSTSRYSSKN